MPATTIDEVIERLDEIILRAKEIHSRLGYFAALYRKVTVEVKQGIEYGLFDDGERMERLDVIFANRYLEAFDRYQSSGIPTLSWQLTFDAAKKRRPIVLQHLLLGMNAHICLDLGIAAAEAVCADELPSLKPDFDKINKVLASMINDVQQELAEVWPLLRVFDLAAGEFDEFLARFGIETARNRAWSVAEIISVLSQEGRKTKIFELDQQVRELSRIILEPGFVLRIVLILVRLGEQRSIPKIIEILE